MEEDDLAVDYSIMWLLARIMKKIAIHDPSNLGCDPEVSNYETRNALIYNALAVAQGNGIPSGIRIDPEDSQWPVVYIETPTGQVSWHVPQHETKWDGHDVKTKYGRIKALCAKYPEWT